MKPVQLRPIKGYSHWKSHSQKTKNITIFTLYLLLFYRHVCVLLCSFFLWLLMRITVRL